MADIVGPELGDSRNSIGIDKDESDDAAGLKEGEGVWGPSALPNDESGEKEQEGSVDDVDSVGKAGKLAAGAHTESGTGFAVRRKENPEKEERSYGEDVIHDIREQTVGCAEEEKRHIERGDEHTHEGTELEGGNITRRVPASHTGKRSR